MFRGYPVPATAFAIKGFTPQVESAHGQALFSNFPWEKGSGVSFFLAHSLKKSIAENAVFLGCSVQIADARIESFRLDNAGSECRFSYTFDHGSECLLGEAFNEMRSARIHVDHPRRDVDFFEARVHHERVELSSDEGIAARCLLQIHLALDGPPGRVAIRMEIGRAVVPFDDCHGAAGLEKSLQFNQGVHRSRKMLQNETDEDMIEGFRGKGQTEYVSLVKFYVGKTCCFDLAFGLRKRLRGDIDRYDTCSGTVAGQRDRLGAHAAPCFEDDAPRGI